MLRGHAMLFAASLATIAMTVEAFNIMPLQHRPPRHAAVFHRRSVALATQKGGEARNSNQEAEANDAQQPFLEPALNPELKTMRRQLVEEAQERYKLASTAGVFAPERALVAASIGCALTAVFYLLGPNLAGIGSGPLERVVLLCKCQIFPSVLLFYLLFVIGGARAVSRATANDPIATRALGLQSLPLLTEHAVMTNTVEQYLVLVSTTAALIFRLPAEQLNLIPSLYVSWTVCRVLFRAGYTSENPRNRQWFFWGNLVPSLGAVLYCIHLIRINGF